MEGMIRKAPSPIQMYNCRVNKGAVLDFTLPADYNTGILILEGGTRINDTGFAPLDNFCLFNNDGTEIKF